MAADDFFSRWSKGKPSAAVPPESAPPTSADQVSVPPSREPVDAPPPTLEDVASLSHDSDFSRFVSRDVDDEVKRSALKKLFSNPHFNVMDRLDVYIDDYNQFDPLTPAMLATLNHAKDLLNPEGRLKQDLLSGEEERADQDMQSVMTSHEEEGQAKTDDLEAGEAPASSDAGDSESKSAESASSTIEQAASHHDAEDKPLSQSGS